jgi:hypothetical protein
LEQFRRVDQCDAILSCQPVAFFDLVGHFHLTLAQRWYSTL